MSSPSASWKYARLRFRNADFVTELRLNGGAECSWDARTSPVCRVVPPPRSPAMFVIYLNIYRCRPGASLSAISARLSALITDTLSATARPGLSCSGLMNRSL